MYRFFTLIDNICILFLESDPKCRYRVHFPKASWHTAYDVCAGENKTLAKISSQIEIQLVDLVLLDVEKLIEDLEAKTYVHRLI